MSLKLIRSIALVPVAIIGDVGPGCVHRLARTIIRRIR